MSPEEEKVWRSIQQKDVQAFESYYKENYRYFLLVAYKYLKDNGLAQEIVNDVFLTVWADGGSITIQVSLKHYLHRAVVNRCLNLLDKTQRDRLRQQQLRQGPQDIAESREMEDNELKIRLYKGIDRLPEQCQKVFRMSRFEELKQQEIADRLGISIKTVKNHITHALKELNKVLGDWNTLPAWILLINYFF